MGGGVNAHKVRPETSACVDGVVYKTLYTTLPPLAFGNASTHTTSLLT